MRQAKILVAVARKAGGKTYITANDVIAPYIQNTINWKGRPVLIYDVNGEWTDKHIREKLKCNFTAKPLALKDLAAWTASGKAEVRRILPLIDKNQFTQDLEEMEEILNKILIIYRNGLLLLEDVNAYLVGVSSKKVISAITRNRQKNLDICIHLQSVRAIPPRLLANATEFRMHKVNENVATIEAKLNNAEVWYIAQALVNFKFKTNIRFFCYIDNEMDKIFGAFSKKDFHVACLLYLQENVPDMYKVAKNRFGNNKEGQKKALEHCILELESKYYGN
jgi:hypothetical protein